MHSATSACLETGVTVYTRPYGNLYMFCSLLVFIVCTMLQFRCLCLAQARGLWLSLTGPASPVDMIQRRHDPVGIMSTGVAGL